MSAPELCAAVLSYRNEDTVLDAVDSLLAQGVPLEIVVSHSGGGPTPRMLATERPQVRVVSSESRRLPGAARNAGVAATTAPFVAFLAADNLAAPGWAAGRLARHQAGAVGVATPLAPVDGGLCSRAIWLNEHGQRLPLREQVADVPHGLSYTRAALQRHGPFPEDRLVGEDTFLNERLIAAGEEIAWAPEVLTLARYATSVPGAVAESYRRGRRAAHNGDPSITLRRRLGWWSRGPIATARRALQAPELPISRMQLWAAMPLMAACASAKVTGGLVSHVSRG